jgi:hypothetical protein
MSVELIMGDEGRAGWLTATHDDTSGLTALSIGANFDVVRWQYRVRRKRWNTTPMTSGTPGFMERYTQSRKKTYEGTITILIPAGAATPKPPGEGAATLTLSHKNGKTIAFNAFLTEAEGESDSIEGGPQRVMYSFISSGGSEVTVTG